MMATINDANNASNIQTVKAASTAPVAGDMAAVVAISPNTPTLPVSIAATVPVSIAAAVSIAGTVPVSIAATVATSAASLPLPSGAATSANQSTLGNQTTKVNDGTNTVAVKAASTAPIVTDPALVVSLSPNSFAAQIKIIGNNGISLDSSIGAAPPNNALLNASRATTANPANATSGNLVANMADKAGRQVVTHVQVRELIAVQQSTIASVSETAIINAGAAGVFNDLIGIVITTAGLAAQTITIKDATAGTTRFVLNYPNAAVAPGAPLQLMFPVPIPQAIAANNWTVTQSLTTACQYTAIFAKNT